MRKARTRTQGGGCAPSPNAVHDALVRLTAASADMLRVDWQQAYGREPPLDLTRDLLLRGVAHRWQERAFGGVGPATQWQLERLAPSGRGKRPRTARTHLRPGMTLVRSWHGQTHTVAVRETGFEFRGRVYRSLTLIAREITGVHWSGPRFFGLVAKEVAQKGASNG